MFTGIVEETGSVEAFNRHATGARLLIRCSRVLEDSTIGSSIAVNGVCLTVVDLRRKDDDAGFSADLAPETLHRSNLGDLQVGHKVNLERPLSLATRLSGHIVQGHVDGTGVIENLRELGDGNWELTVRVPDNLDRLMVYKGSIAIDGISLTIADVTNAVVRVAIIPHTWSATNLAQRNPGDRVNIECDILAKHVEKLLTRPESR